MRLTVNIWLVLMFIFFISADNIAETDGDNPLTVDQLYNASDKYSSKIITVSGEIVWDYHGPVLCNESGSLCFFIVLPDSVYLKPKFELQKDSMYEKYMSLAIEIGSVQKQLGTARLWGILKGRFDNYVVLPNDEERIVVGHDKKSLMVRWRLVLQKVIAIDIKKQ